MNPNLPDRLPTRPLQNWLLAWHLWTGDSVETIARGFNLPHETVAELLGSRPPLMLETAEAIHICALLWMDPAEFWPGRVEAVWADLTGVDRAWVDIPVRLAAVIADELGVVSSHLSARG